MHPRVRQIPPGWSLSIRAPRPWGWVRNQASTTPTADPEPIASMSYSLIAMSFPPCSESWFRLPGLRESYAPLRSRRSGSGFLSSSRTEPAALRRPTRRAVPPAGSVHRTTGEVATASYPALQPTPERHRTGEPRVQLLARKAVRSFVMNGSRAASSRSRRPPHGPSYPPRWRPAGQRSGVLTSWVRARGSPRDQGRMTLFDLEPEHRRGEELLPTGPTTARGEANTIRATLTCGERGPHAASTRLRTESGPRKPCSRRRIAAMVPTTSDVL